MAISSTFADDLKATLPDTTSPLRINGLDAAVEVYCDAFGIPHARAQTVHDAFFAQGFVSAQDRLWQMEYDCRMAYGRWAEYVGKVGLEQDVTLRRFRLGPSVEADYAGAADDTRAMFDAYAEGVNAFIESTQVLPVEYDLVGAKPEPWLPWHGMAVFKVRHLFMGVFESKLWRARVLNELGPQRAAKLFPGYQPGHLLILPPGQVYGGEVLNPSGEFSKIMESVSWMKDTDAGSNS